MDQERDAQILEWSRGVERRSGQDRRQARPHEEPLCFVCKYPAAQRNSFLVRGAEGDIVLHAHCALRFTRDILDTLHHFQADGHGQHAGGDVPLSARELQVLAGMVRGERDREIGERLGLSERTVKNHANEIRRKLGARSRTEAAVRAVRLGLLPEPLEASSESDADEDQVAGIGESITTTA